MSSAFFRQPGDDSSDDRSDDYEESINHDSKQSAGPDPEADNELATTESLSTNVSFSNNNHEDGAQPQNLDEHRDVMFAALLEDFYKTKAVEMANANAHDARYQRHSPEIQPLARQLYAEASRILSMNGLFPLSATSEQSSTSRQQYLSALSNLSLRVGDPSALASEQRRRSLEDAQNALAVVRANKQSPAEISRTHRQPLSDVVSDTVRLSLSSPRSDMQLTLSAPNRSHYESSFQQVRLLGKGGFGNVYHAYNVFDRNSYAVKKIPLSPKLSQRYRESGHQELENVLREVQALSQLEHTNVVRYHSCWIEEPQSANEFAAPSLQHGAPAQRLLDSKPHSSNRMLKPAPNRVESSDGIVFGYSDASRRGSHELPRIAQAWSVSEASQNSTSARASEIFTDGKGHEFSSTDSGMDDSVYVLHVQMSMYPMTLTEYLAPIPATATSALGSPRRRHCFHLMPSLRILLGILCGLQYIHAKGLLHRDIKPGNVFLMSSDAAASWISSEGFYNVGDCYSCQGPFNYHINPRIGDFGLVTELARAAEQRSPRSSSASFKVVGTEYYRPPVYRQSDGRARAAADAKIDVFALGVILVEMLWCCNTATERMHVLQDLQRGKVPRGLAASVDSEGHYTGAGLEVEELIRGMVEHDPGERWSCSRVQERVESVLARCKVRSDTELEKVETLGSAETHDGG